MNAELAKELLSLLVGAGLGGSARLGGSVATRLISSATGGNGGVTRGSLNDAASAFLAKNYPEEFAPSAWHKYDVVNIPITDRQRKAGQTGNFNQHGKSNKSVIDEAGIMQDIDLHNDTIKKYLRPGMTPKEQRIAIERGLQDEKNLPQFWNESKSRRPFSVSSSAVSAIRLTPDARIEVAWATNPAKFYTFKQYENTYEASKVAQKLLLADSIGRAVWPVVSRGVAKPGLGDWNREAYDGNMA